MASILGNFSKERSVEIGVHVEIIMTDLPVKTCRSFPESYPGG
jgi:hypothetical protein